MPNHLRLTTGRRKRNPPWIMPWRCVRWFLKITGVLLVRRKGYLVGSNNSCCCAYLWNIVEKTYDINLEKIWMGEWKILATHLRSWFLTWLPIGRLLNWKSCWLISLFFSLVSFGLGFILLVEQMALVVNMPPANAGDVRGTVSIPGWEIIPWRRAWHALQYSCLENPMDRGAWRATVHSVAKSWTWLKHLSTQSQSDRKPSRSGFQEHSASINTTE